MKSTETKDSFELHGDGGGLTVEVLGKENRDPQTVSDANWLRTRIHFVAGGCEFRISAAISAHNLKHFLEELENLTSSLEGTASLMTDEESISLRVTVGRMGTVQVGGDLIERGGSKVSVNFEFDSDQTFLMKALVKLRDLQRKFPVIESV